MVYDVQLSDGAEKSLAKMDHFHAIIIISWIEKNLKGCENPRSRGTPLVGDKKGYWRYRVGEYRIIADIQDSIVLIEIIRIGHRREAYDSSENGRKPTFRKK